MELGGEGIAASHASHLGDYVLNAFLMLLLACFGGGSFGLFALFLENFKLVFAFEPTRVKERFLCALMHANCCD